MQISAYIKELLLDNDCVIIPNFGGFVANVKPASIDGLRHRFTPPVKDLTFNTRLRNNDGLLISTLSQKESLTWKEAAQKLESWVLEMENALKNEKQYHLNGIGTLTLNYDGNILFFPVENDLLQLSFGLTAFNFLPLEKKEEEKAVVVEKKSQPELKPLVRAEKKKVEVKKYLLYTLALLPVLAYLLWIPTNTEITSGNFTYSDLNPFSNKICPSFSLRKSSLSFEVDTNASDFFKLKNLQSNGLVYLDLEKEALGSGIPSQIFETLVAAPESTLTAVSSKEIYRFHIMAGCFKDYNNAEKLMQDLRSKGFNAAIIDKKNDLYRVAFESFNTRLEADGALASIKSKHNPQSWILVK